MRRVESVHEPGRVDLRVELRRRQGGVAQQFLNAPEIAAARQQVRGERMAQAHVGVALSGSPSMPRISSTASWMMRGDSAPPRAPTKSGPSGGTA